MRRAVGGSRVRSGYTLVELLVAISITGVVVTMVAQWIVHEIHAQVASDHRVDAEEAISTARAALFHDLHRGRILSLTRERMEILSGGSGAERDTVAWTIAPGKLARARGGVVSEPLAALESLEVSWEPVPMGTFDLFGSPWWRLDRDNDGALDGDEFDSVSLLSVRILGKVPTIRGLPSAVESLSVGIPTAGL